MRRLLFATTALIPLGLAPVAANPLDGRVVGGGAIINGTGTPHVTINQSTQNAIINWGSFNIQAGETTQFVQPNVYSTVLNRVTGDTNPTAIYGTLTANGRVFVINPNGVLVGNGAVVETSGFLATTHDITNENFMAGNYRFNIPGRPDASVVNLGTITANNAGFAALVAPGVRNSGTITATFGQIGLASANGFSLDLYGDRLITLNVNDAIAGHVRDVATGLTLRSLVQNTGRLSANGGRVELTAAEARQVVDSVINNTGVIEARSIGSRQGKIVLAAATAATKSAGMPRQTVQVSGSLSVASKRGKGGKIQISGENIEVNDATLNASGYTGGGTILIGGDVGGGNLSPLVAGIRNAHLETEGVYNATTVSINGGTVINASATGYGDGGKVVVWADDTTSFAGTILARGGDLGGNGGFAEVSGKKTLNYLGTADMRAPQGSFGTLLLDPEDFTVWNGIGPAPAGSSMVNSALVAQLQLGNFVIATNNAINPGGQNGDVFFNAPVVWSANTTLTVNAFRHIIINDTGPTGTIRNTGGGNLLLRADSTGTGVGTVQMPASTNAVRVDWSGSTGKVTVYYNPSSYTTPTNFTVGNGRFQLASGSQLTAFMLVNSLANFQGMVDPGSGLGNYALGRDINGFGGTFNPLTFTFTGIFDGLGHTISNVNVNGRAALLFNSGIIRNLNLSNFTVSASGNNQNLGLLVGNNNTNGQIINVTTSGTINGGSFSGINAGGIAGINGGLIAGSSAAVNITVGNGVPTMGNFNSVGGIAGVNVGTINLSSASGAIVGGSHVFLGGLVGLNGLNSTQQAGVISQSSSSVAVSSAGTNVSIGGVAGINALFGLITDSSSTGNVMATGDVPLNPCNANFCEFVHAGGFVGRNFGIIGGTLSQFSTFATGAVQVGRNALGGGFAAYNEGFIFNASAGGTVIGGAGIEGDTGRTVIGGFVGNNRGVIGASRATGNVGSSVERLMAGGFVGNNVGTILVSQATGNVVTGNRGQAGGFAGSGEGDCPFCGPIQSPFGNNAGLIAGSTASGSVTVGSFSVAGGFVGIGSTIMESHSTGNVVGGADSILGGFAGVHEHGSIENSTSTGSVMALGARVWLGAFAGLNIGTLKKVTGTGALSGTSDSIFGGVSAVNIGWITGSSAASTMVGNGANNFFGGIVGANFGSVDTSQGSGSMTGGVNSIMGTQVGVMGSFINIPPGLIPNSSFPTGTLASSSSTSTMSGGPGSITGSPVGVTNPSRLPPFPGVIDGCVDQICTLVRSGVLAGGGSNPDNNNPVTVPNPVQAPPVFSGQVPPPSNNAPVALIALTQPPSGAAPGSATPAGPAGGSSGNATPPGATTSYANSTPGQPQFAPPPLPTRLGPDGAMVVSGIPPIGETRFQQNQVVMQLNLNFANEDLERLLRRLNIRVTATDTLTNLGKRLVSLQLPAGMSVRQALRSLETNRFVPEVAPVYLFKLAQQPVTSKGDPAQYMMGKLQLEKVHQIATGKGVTIAVIDSAADRGHAELKGAIAEELDALGAKEQPHSHGTAMIGAIASRDRLLGVAPNANILAVRAFGEANNTAEGTTVTIIKGIEWAVSQGAKVINMSFAGPRDPALERAIKIARDKGVIMIAAAGNAGPKSPPLYPAADPNVIAVTATDVKDRGFRGANQGPQVSVASPGVEILAPAPEEAYQMSTGTSIATAHISGVVALMLERDPTLKPADVRRILEETATDLGPKGKDAQYGWGLVNPQKALEAVNAQRKTSDASGARRGG